MHSGDAPTLGRDCWGGGIVPGPSVQQTEQMLAAKRLDTKETMKKEICESTQTNYTLVQQKIECFADSTAKSMRKRKNRSCSTWPVHSNFVKDPKQGEREILSCSVNVCVRVYSTRGTT